MDLSIDADRYSEQTGLGLAAIAGAVGAVIAMGTASGPVVIGLITAITTVVVFGLLAGLSVLTVE